MPRYRMPPPHLPERLCQVRRETKRFRRNRFGAALPRAKLRRHQKRGTRDMSDFRKLIDSKAGRGCTIEVYQVTRNVVTYVGRQTQIGRQVRLKLDGGSALLEPGAFQY